MILSQDKGRAGARPWPRRGSALGPALPTALRRGRWRFVRCTRGADVRCAQRAGGYAGNLLPPEKPGRWVPRLQ